MLQEQTKNANKNELTINSKKKKKVDEKMKL